MENIKEQLEEVIKKNLPENKENADKKYDIYSEQRRLAFNQALSQINTSLIADEVLKVVVEFITGNLPLYDDKQFIKVEDIKKLSNLSPNKENK